MTADTTPTLVLLPGMDGTGDLFAPLAAVLVGHLPVQVLRYPPDLPAGYEELSDFVRAALPRDRPFVLLGESFSGPIAVTLASEAPSNLRGLVLCCSFVRNPVPWLAWLAPFARWLPVRSVPTRLIAWFLLGRSSTAAWRDALGLALAKVSATAIRARARAVLTVDATSALRQTSVPLLYLRASEDRVVPASASRAVLRARPDATLVELVGPHFLLQEAPALAAEAIQAFACRIPSSSPAP